MQNRTCRSKSRKAPDIVAFSGAAPTTRPHGERNACGGSASVFGRRDRIRRATWRRRPPGRGLAA
eukprot:12864197-Alexandrium_andersonii.AAC.1